MDIVVICMRINIIKINFVIIREIKSRMENILCDEIVVGIQKLLTFAWGKLLKFFKFDFNQNTGTTVIKVECNRMKEITQLKLVYIEMDNQINAENLNLSSEQSS